MEDLVDPAVLYKLLELARSSARSYIAPPEGYGIVVYSGNEDRHP